MNDQEHGLKVDHVCQRMIDDLRMENIELKQALDGGRAALLLMSIVTSLAVLIPFSVLGAVLLWR